jgi:hypothetical protein
MGYEHIEHLYKHPEFFKNFTQAYALEKIHGTSTWINFKSVALAQAQVQAQSSNDTDPVVDHPVNAVVDHQVNPTTAVKLETKQTIDEFRLTFHSGGETAESFAGLFDYGSLEQKLFQIVTKNKWHGIRVHGEAYGGKQQKMAHTYGPVLRFVVFDIKINDTRFLNIQESEKIARELNLDFVHYEIGPCIPEWFDQQTKKNSIQAIKNGMGEGKLQEGIIVRPLTETIDFNNRRVIYKHKNPEFWEIASARTLGTKLVLMTAIKQIADDFVTKQRAEHVINHIISEREQKYIEFKDVGLFVDAMVQDIKREGDGEIKWSRDVEKEIKKRAGLLFRSIVALPKKSKQLPTKN